MALTDEDRSRGGHASRIARQKKRLALRQRSDVLWRVVEGLDADKVPDFLVGRAMETVNSLNIPECETPTDFLKLVSAADVLYKMGRLAGGQSTSNTATWNSDAMAQVLRDRLAQLEQGPPLPD